MTPQQEAAHQLFQERMLKATGYTFREYERVRDAGPGSLKHVKFFSRIVDESGAIGLLETWRAAERKAPSGRKPILNFRATLTLFLMHMQDGGDIRYDEAARTLAARLTPEAFDDLEIRVTDGTRDQWYHRIWRGMNRILALTSPWDVPRNTFLSAEGYRLALETYSQERRDRMDALANLLVQTAARRLPTDIRSTYRGNVAIDATLLAVPGRPNPGRKHADSPRRNLDAMSGPYQRGGNHEGTGITKNLAGWEAETVVTLPNRPGDPESFPILTTGVTLHQPGRIKHGPRIAVEYHAKLFTQRGYLIADRAYNGLKPERFQHPVRKLGFRSVYSFKDKATGKQGAIGDAILVDGHLYIKWMPIDLVNASRDFFLKKCIDRVTYERRLTARTAYALKDHGAPEPDGSQRFTFPNLARLLCIDALTGKVVRPKLAHKSIKLNPTDKAAMRIIKNLQGFEYRSADWYRWNGLRSHVESNNQYLKDDAYTDLRNASKRRPRGYAYQALAFAAAATVANMRRIVTFITSAALKKLTLKELRTDRPTT